MLKKFFIFLAIALAIFLVLCWIYLPSVTRYRELKLEEEKLNKRIHDIDMKIKGLAEEKNLLQTDVAYLEKVIREELGFVKPGEIVYELVTKKGAPVPKPDAPAVAPALASKTTPDVAQASVAATSTKKVASATAVSRKKSSSTRR
ncbi:MAG TPA: septum formation initiator family protein [Candidatus Omnitrophota bacterium]|nr:septum formation initiator family protein [Candidatus Omnitrophota bacterium]HPS36151.1 septum formation initiator family protein [Candidatus Omnitrophota bacterium]